MSLNNRIIIFIVIMIGIQIYLVALSVHTILYINMSVGWGVVAMRGIEPGEFVCEYRAPLCTAEPIDSPYVFEFSTKGVAYW